MVNVCAREWNANCPISGPYNVSYHSLVCLAITEA